MNLLQRLLGNRKIERQIEVIRRDTSKLRLNEFRQAPALVSSAQRTLSSIDMQVMLDVLKNEHPGNEVYAVDAPIHLRAAQQARCEGYTMALANLESMAVLLEPRKPLEPTFSDDTAETLTQ